MVRSQLYAAVLAVFGMAGCGVVDTTARDPAPFSVAGVSDAMQRPESPVVTPRRGYVVADLNVNVPRDLRVSEANAYYPMADIVWRGDPYGDRYAQVAEIFRDGFALLEPTLTGGPQVVAEVELHRFHALTEKARYTIGGMYSVRFLLTLRDAASGAVLDGPRLVKADMRASGGARALAEEASGLTQRVAITRHLATVLADELALPGTVNPGGSAGQTADALAGQPVALSTGTLSDPLLPVGADGETAVQGQRRVE